MIIRVPQIEIDTRRLAAILTPALLTPTKDDAPHAKAHRPGTGWLYWGDIHHSASTHLN